MWKNEILVWEDSPSIVWNNFGEITSETFNNDNDLYVQGVVVWRKITLGDFIEKTIEFLESGTDFLEDRNILTGAMLTISVINFLPLHLEIIKDDEVANEFLQLVNRENATHYILKKDFEESKFSKVEALNLLITKLIKNNLLEETTDKYYINGTILKSIHFWESSND